MLKNAQAQKAKRLKLVEVERAEDYTVDTGTLLLADPRPVDKGALKGSEAGLLALTRENAQLLFNAIWELPVIRDEDAVLAKLPTPTTLLPREKPVGGSETRP